MPLTIVRAPAPTFLLCLVLLGSCRCGPALTSMGEAPHAARSVEETAYVPAATCPIAPGAHPVGCGHPEAAEPEFLAARAVEALTAFEAAFDAGRFDEALACAQEAARAAPHRPEAHHARATSYEALELWHEAHLAYERALALDPHDAETLRSAAEFHLRGGALDGLETAVLYARRGREHAAEAALGAELAALEAEASNLLGRAGEALRAAETALALDGDEPRALRERAVALFELLRFEEARAAVGAARARDSGNARTAFHAALIAERDGRTSEAEALFREAAKLDPDAYPLPPRVAPADFARLLEEEVGALPGPERALLASAQLTWEELPALEDLAAGVPVLSPTILGLFRPGEPGKSDAIVLYRRNLLRLARSLDELRREVRRTLLHEIGHLVGESDAELRDRGL